MFFIRLIKFVSLKLILFVNSCCSFLLFISLMHSGDGIISFIHSFVFIIMIVTFSLNFFVRVNFWALLCIQLFLLMLFIHCSCVLCNYSAVLLDALIVHIVMLFCFFCCRSYIDDNCFFLLMSHCCCSWALHSFLFL